MRSSYHACLACLQTAGQVVAVALVMVMALGLSGCNIVAPAGSDSNGSNATVATMTPVIIKAPKAPVDTPPTPLPPPLPMAVATGAVGAPERTLPVTSPAANGDSVGANAAGTAVSMQTQESAYAGMQATSMAHATASPYPSAGPVQVQVQSGKPALATVRQGGLTLELRLPKDSYLAGEAGQAQVTVHNDGPEKLFGRDVSIALVDRDGLALAWPLMPLTRNEPGGAGGEGNMGGVGGRGQFYELAPGQTISRTFAFQVPPMGASTAIGDKGTGVPDGEQYSLWAGTRFSRGLSASGGRGPDFVVLNLEAGPLPLEIREPQQAQLLRTTLKADSKGYQLSVVDAKGRPPASPPWGEVQTTWQNSMMASRLEENAGGTWSGTWPNPEVGSGGQLTVWAYVAAEGYVTTATTQTIPTGAGAGAGGGTAVTSNSQVGAQDETFSSREAARSSLASLGITASAPGNLPEGAALKRVRVVSVRYEGGSWSDVRQVYKPAGAAEGASGASLQLVQMSNIGNSPGGFGPESPEFRAAAQRTVVGEREIYTMQRFGRWLLVWKMGSAGFEMSAPVSALSLEKLLEVAGSVGAVKP